MKHNRWMMASLLGGALLLSAGCVQEKSVETGGIPGTRIVFAAMTNYENNEDTRTEYSGVLYGTTDKIERIDWVAGTDKFTVNYAAGSSFTTADYLVTSVNADNYNSKAGVTENNKAEILQWAEGSDHKFYAMYPPHSVNSTASLTSVNHFQATLPAAQPQTHQKNVTVNGKTWSRYLPDMNNAYMVAYAGTDNGMVTSAGVTLPFRPAVTTFEFRLRRNKDEDGGNIQYFKLKSAGHALTGQFSFNITGGDNRGGLWENSGITVETKTDANSVITVDFGAEGVALPAYDADGYLDFTVFAVPKTENVGDLSIELIEVGGTKRELPLKDKDASGEFTNYHQFTGGKKYVITNSTVPGEWIYEIIATEDIVAYGHDPVSNLPYGVKSYKRSGSTYIPVPWVIQYTLDGGTTWTNLTTAGAYTDGNDPDPNVHWNATFKSNILSGVGTGNKDMVNPGLMSIEGISEGLVEGDEVAAAQRAKLASHEPRGKAVGTTDGPFDLSIHPVYGDIDGEVPQTTANCYVISAPGYYMFPCVYGNGITNNDVNKSAFWPGEAAEAGVNDPGAGNLKEVNENYNTDDAYWRAYTPRFYNAINDKIKSPYIYDDLGAVGSESAVVVWQDTDSDHLIIPFSDDDYVGITTKNIGGKNVKYIWFRIDADRIKTGNFVLGLKGTVPGHLTSPELLWSWHIWINPDDLTPNDVVSNTTGTYRMMPKNLGWFDSDHGSTSQYPTREMQFRVVQTEPNLDVTQNKKDDLNVTQIGDADSTQPTVGGNVYYQWGRKDPFLPVAPDGTNHPATYAQEYLTPPARITFTTNGIAEKVLPDTYLDYGASIREPFTPFKNASSINYIGGPVYPWKRDLGGGTQVNTWTFKPGHERRGPFSLAQSQYLQQTSFCDESDWETLVDGMFYHNGVAFKWGTYTDAEKTIMLANGFVEGDFTGSSNNWTLTYWKLGPFTPTQAVALLGTTYNLEGPNYWTIPSSSSADPVGYAYHNGKYLPGSVPFYSGPYNYDEAVLLSRDYGGFSLDATTGDFIVETTTIGGGGLVPYPASMRSEAANVNNLWNAYVYDEETAGSSYVNKYKTIYDPCPPGFTVPVKQVFVGARTFSDADRWTSLQSQGGNGMHMKISAPGDVFANESPALYYNGLGDNTEMKGMLLSGGAFLPFTGARVFRDPDGKGTVLHAEGMGTAGYYWSDSPLRSDWRFPTDPSSPFYEAGQAHDETVGRFWFYFDAYGLIFGNDSAYDKYLWTYPEQQRYRVQSYTRASAFSIRPMKDPRVNY